MYSLFLGVAAPQVPTFQNQWIGNYARAEDYIYASGDYQVVIVGTSLAAKLHRDRLEGSVYNLAFDGGSVLTGLNIVLRAKHYPRIILVESNFIDAVEDKNMLDSLFTPVEWRIKQYAQAMQDKYQPVNLLLSILFPERPSKVANKLKQRPNPEVLERNLQINGAALNVKPMALDQRNLNKVKELIGFFRSRNVRVYFFRMPVNPALAESEKFVVTARELKTWFPEISMLPQPNDAKYETEDGVHLTYRAALWFTEDFNRWVDDLIGREANADGKPRT